MRPAPEEDPGRDPQRQHDAQKAGQASPQDHLGGSPHFVVVDSSRPQWHRPGGPTAWHFGQGPGWQSSGQRCLQPRSRSQTSPQLCANQCGLGSGSKIFVQKHVYCGIGPAPTSVGLVRRRGMRCFGLGACWEAQVF